MPRLASNKAAVHAPETPNKARIKLLSARIAGVHNEREAERQLRHESILGKVKATEDFLARTQINSEGNDKLARDRIGKLGNDRGPGLRAGRLGRQAK